MAVVSSSAVVAKSGLWWWLSSTTESFLVIATSTSTTQQRSRHYHHDPVHHFHYRHHRRRQQRRRQQPCGIGAAFHHVSSLVALSRPSAITTTTIGRQLRKRPPEPQVSYSAITRMMMSTSSSSNNNNNNNNERVSNNNNNSQTQKQQQQVLLRTLDQGSHMAEMEVKKSRFLGYAKSVNHWKEAQAYISQLKQEHPKARHWCFGYVAGSSGGGAAASAATAVVEERCSDDGEPTGTAGLPILGAIKGEGLSNTVCVVVRYFGGTKLGAGNLLRAYGASARLVLRQAPTVVLIPTTLLRVYVPSSSMAGAVYDATLKLQQQQQQQQHATTISNEQYEADGSFSVHVVCATDQIERFQTSLLDATRGSAIVTPVVRWNSEDGDDDDDGSGDSS